MSLTITEIANDYGIVEDKEGIWRSYHMECPACKTKDALLFDVNMEEEGVLDHSIKCNKCQAEFAVGYVIDPEITLERLK